jgi:predicted nucleic acid-binding protein
MIAEVFLDANILLYACSSAPADRAKQQRAEALILNTPFVLSAQVLQEFIANALKKKALGITEANIDAMLELASHVRVLPITHELILIAVAIRRRFQVSHWDSTIIAAAKELGCKTLYSEDLNHDQVYDGVTVINPFL